MIVTVSPWCEIRSGGPSSSEERACSRSRMETAPFDHVEPFWRMARPDISVVSMRMTASRRPPGQGSIPESDELLELGRVVDETGASGGEDTPSFAHCLVDAVDLEADGGACRLGERACGADAEDDVAVDETEVHRQRDRAPFGQEDEAADATQSEMRRALFLAQYVQPRMRTGASGARRPVDLPAYSDGQHAQFVRVFVQLRRSLPRVHEAAKRGVFAYIVDASPEELQSAIDITLQRFNEYHSLQGAFGRRALIEQAKGVLMARHSINADRRAGVEPSLRCRHRVRQVYGCRSAALGSAC
jgi:hypothetical protein